MLRMLLTKCTDSDPWTDHGCCMPDVVDFLSQTLTESASHLETVSPAPQILSVTENGLTVL